MGWFGKPKGGTGTGGAAQAAADIAEVNTNLAKIQNGQTVLTGSSAGTYAPTASVTLSPTVGCRVDDAAGSAPIGQLTVVLDYGCTGIQLNVVPSLTVITFSGSNIGFTTLNRDIALSGPTLLANVNGLPATLTTVDLHGASLSLTTVKLFLAFAAANKTVVGTMDLAGGTSSAPDTVGWASYDTATSGGGLWTITVNGSHP